MPFSTSLTPSKTTASWVASLLALATSSFWMACEAPKPPAFSFSTEEKALIASHSPLPPLPKSPTNRFADDPKAAHFGQFLFFDRRLSSNGQVSCGTCHNPALGWGDDRPFSQGIGKTGRHTPALWNLPYYRWFFWDGRTDTLWSQALQPLESPVEMGTSRLEIAHLLAKDSALREAYTGIFGPLPDLSDPKRFPAKGRPTPDDPSSEMQQAWDSMAPDDQTAINRVFSNLGKALEAFQRKLLSKDAPFDRFAKTLQTPSTELSKDGPISLSAQRGLKLFIGKGGCNLCHTGPNFSDSEFHNTGLPLLAGASPDVGRMTGIDSVLSDIFNGLGVYSDDTSQKTNAHLHFLNKNPANLGAFKTPTLREIASNPPYMHDGRFPSLEEAVTFYSELPGTPPIGHREESLKPLQLTKEEIADLVAFLKTLSADPPPPDLTRQPLSPKL